MNKRKNVLIISAVFPPEPVVSANLSYDIAKELSDRANVVVLSPKPSRPEGYSFKSKDVQHNEFKHIVLDSYTCPKSSVFGRFRESYSFGSKCYKHILENDYDLIYINTWPILAQYLSVKASKKRKIPIITHIQDIYPESLINRLTKAKTILYKIFLPIDKYILSESARVIAISNGMKDYLCQTRSIEQGHIEVIYNWQDKARYVYEKKCLKKVNDTGLVFMFVGSLSPSAGLDIVIKAFIKANLSLSKLIIAGSGSDKEKLEKISKTTSLDIEIIDCPSEKVGEIQNKADVLVLSLKKGVGKLALPSKLPAYMFSAKPIIASVDLDSDIANIILDSESGWIVESESVDMLGELFVSISKEEYSVLKEKGERGFEYATKKFSRDENLRKIMSLFELL